MSCELQVMASKEGLCVCLIDQWLGCLRHKASHSCVSSSFTEVDGVGWLGIFCYGLVIPCFLGLLFLKQNILMRPAKTFLAQRDEEEGGSVTLRLQSMTCRQSIEDWPC